MLKTLIATACIAVIAIAGLLFWQANQNAEAREVAAQRAATHYCQSVPDKIAAGVEIPDLNKVLTGCLFRKDITKADLDQAMSILKATY